MRWRLHLCTQDITGKTLKMRYNYIEVSRSMFQSIFNCRCSSAVGKKIWYSAAALTTDERFYTSATYQPINLYYDVDNTNPDYKYCLSQNIIEHEMMHSVGFFHEQTRPDRDDYVQIEWNNIVSGNY